MNKRVIIAVLWGLFFAVCFNWLFYFVLFLIEVIFITGSESEMLESLLFDTLHSVATYIPLVFLILGAWLGLHGKLPGTKISESKKENPFAVWDTTEAEYAKKLLEQRPIKVTQWTWIKMNVGLYRLLFLFFVLLVIVAYLYEASWLYLFLPGALVSFLWRDSIECSRTKIIRPFSEKIIDWEKVEQIANGEKIQSDSSDKQ